PRWLQWLAGRHEYSGFTRQQLLDDAVRTGNAHRVISLLRGYQQALAAGRASQWTPPPAEGRNKPVYRRAHITNAHRAYMKGAYKGREAEYEALQADQHRAIAEGRIIDLPVVRGKEPHG